MSRTSIDKDYAANLLDALDDPVSSEALIPSLEPEQEPPVKRTLSDWQAQEELEKEDERIMLNYLRGRVIESVSRTSRETEIQITFSNGTGIEIGACGCCNSPWIEEFETK